MLLDVCLRFDDLFAVGLLDGRSIARAMHSTDLRFLSLFLSAFVFGKLSRDFVVSFSCFAWVWWQTLLLACVMRTTVAFFLFCVMHD